MALVLVLIFLRYPAMQRFKYNVNIMDLVLVALVLGSIGYMLIDFEDFIYRAVTPYILGLGVRRDSAGV